MKKITNILKVLMFLLIATILFTPAGEVRAKSNTINVTLKSDDDIDKAVKTVHSNALKHKKMVLKIKGNKKKSRKTLEKFEKQLQLYNTYSVIINVDENKTKKGYTSYTITKDDTKTYTYAIQYVKYCIGVRKNDWEVDKREWQNIRQTSSRYYMTGSWEDLYLTNPDGTINFNRLNPEPIGYIHPKYNAKDIIWTPKDWTGSWVDYANTMYADDSKIDNNVQLLTAQEYYNLPSDFEQYLPKVLLFERGYTFAQLSTLQQQEILFGVPYNASAKTRDHAKGLSWSDTAMMKRIANRTTKSMCWECAKYQICIENQLNIPSDYIELKTKNHSYMVAYVEFKGKAYMQKWENGYHESQGLGVAIIGDHHDYYDYESLSVEERMIKYASYIPVPNSKLKAHTYLH